jgi:diketogulonate reductase-like aldo/keto reductase
MFVSPVDTYLSFHVPSCTGGLNASQVRAAHEQNLLELGLDYVDHLMTHFPADWDEAVGTN